MTELQLHTRLSSLFRETSSAHRAEFTDSEGRDPEWPLWYAEFMQVKLAQLLGRELTVSELVYWLFQLDKEYRAKSLATPWPTYYAQVLVAEYA